MFLKSIYTFIITKPRKIMQLFKKDDTKNFILFTGIALIGIIIFIAIPTLCSFGLSFFKWDMLSKPEWTGISNYIKLFKNPKFWFILKNTLVFSLATTFFAVVLPVILAGILNEKVIGKEFFKTSYFLPFITPMIVIAIVWQWIFDPNMGLLNYILKININWLYDPDFAMTAMIIVQSWKLIGYNTIILLSGFGNINSSVIEAAEIDGASPITKFFKIIIPLLSPTILFVIIVTTISSFQVFDLVYMMTQGGPENSTNVLVYWLYQEGFEYFNIGQASCIAYVLFTIIAVLSIFQWKTRKKWVNED